MGAGFRGAFAIRWSDSEIDGQRDAPLEALTVGAAWSWAGRAVRLDGPDGVLRLEDALGAAELSARAAARLGAAPASDQPPAGPPAGEGFAVTDGRREFPVAIVRDPVSGRLLLNFRGALPAEGAELWVTAVGARRGRSLAAPQGVVCFAGGTRLRTPQGERAVEELRPGDLVLTRDDGARPVLWAGSTRLSGARLHVSPGLRPVRIRARALGGEVPDAELLVSPQHRLLVRGRAVQALFGADEVLAQAADLIDDRLILIAQALRELTYHHILLARHQIVWANGLPAESFHPGAMPLGALEAGQRTELCRLFPGLARDPASYGAPARRLLTRAEAAILRHGWTPGARAGRRP